MKYTFTQIHTAINQVHQLLMFHVMMLNLIINCGFSIEKKRTLLWIHDLRINLLIEYNIETPIPIAFC